ncbi:MAG TPA: hypothetical protein VD833_08115 [Vicinamibacterales bacterium]|nr:hypothetical protein [Vicinamibacterales bacterium]
MRADLALVGFGNVARRFVRLLDERRSDLNDTFDLECRIVAIATRRHGARLALEGLDPIEAAATVERGAQLDATGQNRALDAIRLLGTSTSPLRVVLETTTLEIKDGEPARSHLRAALDAGCHVVTANKGPAAFAWRELQAHADARGLSFLFEGAVMDGVPVLSLVRETLPAVRVLGFRGVVNSTTNHVLTALEDGEPFGPALARMQAEGIAEADASLDLEGWDAAAKAAVLANVWLDARITPHDVERQGLGPGTAVEAQAARARGRRLRLVASAARGKRPTVRPTELEGHDLLAGLRGMANALVIETDLLGRIAVTQLDGGLTQTAYALLSDLVTIRRRTAARPGAPARRIPGSRGRR